MPVQPATLDGRPGFRWGTRGKVYTYRPGDEAGRRRARALATRQGQAIKARAARADAETPPKPPRRPSARPLIALYRRVVREWAQRMRERIIRAMRAWRTDRLPALRPRLDSDDDGDALNESEAADLIYWLRREMSDEPIRLPAAPSQAAIEAFARQAARRVVEETRRAMIRAGADAQKLTSRLGLVADVRYLVDIAPTEMHRVALEEFTRANLDLIVRIPQEWLVGTERWMSSSIRAGARYTAIQDELISRLGISDRHARLIARDQVGKLNGQITETTQQLAGVDSYTWITVGDERVRGNPGGLYPRAHPSHFALNGKVFKWSDPPISGPGTQRRHPGGPVQCRCFGQPVLPDDLMAD